MASNANPCGPRWTPALASPCTHSEFRLATRSLFGESGWLHAPVDQYSWELETVKRHWPGEVDEIGESAQSFQLPI